MLAASKKFLVASAGLAVAVGVLDEGTAQTIVAALTPVLVWLIPN